MRKSWKLAAGALAAAVCAGVMEAPGAAPARIAPTANGAKVDFVKDVQPLLSAHCYRCHSEKLHKGDLRLDQKSSALRVKDAIILPGDGAHSELVDRITTADADEHMPPPDKAKPLSAEEVGVLRRWIDEGANWPQSADAADAGRNHWAYQRPAMPAVPGVKETAWPRNEIDRFVLAKMEAAGRAPAHEASRLALLRRVSLDLTGLPPTPAEIDAFLKDDSTGAYEKAVDRLLASPRYGEKWARQWLDLARYADTNGYEKDSRRTMWRYRDWVIGALNANMRFDEFTLEQVAGDLLPGATLEQKIATGFLRNSMINEEGGVDPEEYRHVAVFDRTDTVATVWLGSTLACAKCHDHKYDPFSQKEYYSFFAFFNDQDDAVIPAPSDAQAAALTRQKARLAELKKQYAAPSREIDASQAIWEELNAPFARMGAKLSIPKEIYDILKMGRQKRSTKQAAAIAAYYRTIAPALKGVREEMGRLQAAIAQIPTAMVVKELPKPRETYVHIRGSFLSKGEDVRPGVPKVLGPLAQGKAGAQANRLDLARWLVSDGNPLTARVVMNRMWEAYFGRGLVSTVEDFGTQGDRPQNQALLDWLACTFEKSGWDVKSMHKRIVMSATYRQASEMNPEMAEADPYNILLTHTPRLRVEAEEVRDIGLAAAGLLDERMGGPGVMPFQPDGLWRMPYSGDRWVNAANGDRYRRGIYTFLRRTAPYPAFLTFDATSREVCTARRARTNTPLQALATMNDEAFVENARGLGRRLMLEGGAGAEAKIKLAFLLVLSRPPEEREMRRVKALFDEQLAHFQKDKEAAKKLAADLPGVAKPARALDASELAAWTVVANVMLNLDEAITRQ